MTRINHASRSPCDDASQSYDDASSQPHNADGARYAKITRAVITDKLTQLTKTEILVYSFVATYANEATRRAWPSLATIAAGVKCTRENVCRAIKKLEKVGLLHKQPRWTQAGDRNSTL